MSDVFERVVRLRCEMELRWTGQFVENAICTLDEAAATIARLEAELAEARDKALDEAAQVAWNYEKRPLTQAYGWTPQQAEWWTVGKVDCAFAISQAIRALKSPKPQED